LFGKSAYLRKLCFTPLDGDIFSLNPAKLAQLFAERLPKDGAARSGAYIQAADAENFSCLLRGGPSPTNRECDNDRHNPNQF
jgi:hypothetical protein